MNSEMNRHGSRFERPHSEQLVDLHIYIVPQDLWQDRLNSALNQIVDDTVSGGFVRVLPETTIYGLREEVGKQIGFEVIPRDYVFLKSVGRCLTRVKPKQELQMKVKHFLPPHSYSPEIFLLEPTPQMRGMMLSDDDSLRNSSYNSSPGRGSIGGRRAIDQQPGAKVSKQIGYDYDSRFGRRSFSKYEPLEGPLSKPYTPNGNNAHDMDNESDELRLPHLQELTSSNNTLGDSARDSEKAGDAGDEGDNDNVERSNSIFSATPPNSAADRYYNNNNKGKHQGQNGDITVWDRRKSNQGQSSDSRESGKPNSQQSQPSYSDTRHYRQELQESRRNPDNHAHQENNKNVLRGNRVDNTTYRANNVLPPLGSQGFAIDRGQGQPHDAQDPRNQPNAPDNRQGYERQSNEQDNKNSNQGYVTYEDQANHIQDVGGRPNDVRPLDAQARGYDEAALRDSKHEGGGVEGPYQAGEQYTRNGDERVEPGRGPHEGQAGSQGGGGPLGMTFDAQYQNQVQGQNDQNQGGQYQGHPGIDGQYHNQAAKGQNDPYQQQPGSDSQYHNQAQNDPYQNQPGSDGQYQAQGQNGQSYQGQPGNNGQYQNQGQNGQYQGQPGIDGQYQNQGQNGQYQGQPGIDGQYQNQAQGENGQYEPGSDGHFLGDQRLVPPPGPNFDGEHPSDHPYSSLPPGDGQLPAPFSNNETLQPGSEEFLKRKQQEEEEKLRRDEDARRRDEDARRRAEEEWRQDEESRRAGEARRMEEAHAAEERKEADRRRKEEEERRLVEEKRKREEEERLKEEGRRRKDFPSPPPLTVTSYMSPAEEKEKSRSETDKLKYRYPEDRSKYWEKELVESHHDQNKPDGSPRRGKEVQSGSKYDSKETPSDEKNSPYASKVPIAKSRPKRTPEYYNKIKKQILAELEETRQRRREIEARREDLVRKAKQLQAKTQSRRNQARDMWKKKYFEEKKKTPALEDKCNRLRHELELLHRKIVGQMEGGKGREKFQLEKGENRPSEQSNLRIQATKLHHEIEEFQRRVDDAKMKLTGEVKLRNQAEAELRALRAELTQKKINVTLTRSQKLAALGSSQDVYTPHPAAISPRS